MFIWSLSKYFMLLKFKGKNSLNDLFDKHRLSCKNEIRHFNLFTLKKTFIQWRQKVKKKNGVTQNLNRWNGITEEEMYSSLDKLSLVTSKRLQILRIE